MNMQLTLPQLAAEEVAARALSGITKDIEFNAALWDLTEEFAK